MSDVNIKLELVVNGRKIEAAPTSPLKIYVWHPDGITSGSVVVVAKNFSDAVERFFNSAHLYAKEVLSSGHISEHEITDSFVHVDNGDA